MKFIRDFVLKNLNDCFQTRRMLFQSEFLISVFHCHCSIQWIDNFPIILKKYCITWLKRYAEIIAGSMMINPKITSSKASVFRVFWQLLINKHSWMQLCSTLRCQYTLLVYDTHKYAHALELICVIVANSD